MATVTPEGLIIRALQEIKDAIYETWATQPALGPTFITSPESPQAQLSEPFAEAVLNLEEALNEGLIQSRTRSGATGVWLDALGEAVGVVRQQPTKSTVTATVTLDAGVTLPTGSQAADILDDEHIYETLVDVTNSSGVTATFSVAMRAVTEGSSIFVAANNLTEIVTPVVGWSAVVNASDAAQGRDQETDAEYRIRQVEGLTVSGSATVASIRSTIRNVAGVASATILENDQPVFVDGLPPNSIEAVVVGGAADDIAQAILDTKAAGIQAFGSTTGVATDDEGETFTVAFSRPDEVQVYVSYTLTTDGAYIGHSAFKEAVAEAAGAFFGLADDVIYSKFFDFAFNQQGVVDVTALAIGVFPAPVGTSNIPLGSRDSATFSTTDMLVNGV